MKHSTITLIVLFFIIHLFGCKKPEQPSTDGTSVSVVYACSPETSHILDVKENGQFQVGIGTGIYGSGTNEIALWYPNVDLTFTFSGNGVPDTVVGKWQIARKANQRYSVFFGGPASNPCKIFMEDALSTPDKSRALVRFINLSSDSNIYNVYFANTKLDSMSARGAGLAYQGISQYYFTPTGTNTVISFKDSRDSTISIKFDNANVNAGFIYSFILCGNKGVDKGLYIKKILQNPMLTL